MRHQALDRLERAEAIAARDALLAMFKPAERLRLAEWSQKYVKLPESASARPGDLRHWPYMIDPLNSMTEVERTTIMKSMRLGFTKGVIFAAGGFSAINPSNVIILVPTDDDADRLSEDDLSPIFEASPVLKDLLARKKGRGPQPRKRKTLSNGYTIKILSARAPRKLRAHDAKYLLMDEIDGMEITKEGDPLIIAEGRTFAHGDRRIIAGSTPTEEGISPIDRRYSESDQRIYEVPCPFCGVFNEIQWEQIIWDTSEEGHKPETARYRCPHCETDVPERYKVGMVEHGKWRTTRPWVQNHHGYRINALVSLLPNASWPKLAAEWLKAKRGGPSEIQPFVNLILGRVYRLSVNPIDADLLRERSEDIGLHKIPAEVVMLTCGVDVQDDRLELTVLGWPVTGAPSVLTHRTIAGNTLEDEVWGDLNIFLRTKWDHPNGWKIGIDGTAVDSGGHEGRTEKVYDWTSTKAHRRIFAIKGRAGPNRIWKKAEKTKHNATAYIVAVDVVKTEVQDALGHKPWLDDGSRNPAGMRYSKTLPEEWYEQVTNEVRRIKYVGNRPKIVFEVKRQGLRNEALDSTVYAYAVRRAASVNSIDLVERSKREPLPELVPVETPPPVDARVIPATGKKTSMADWATFFNG